MGTSNTVQLKFGKITKIKNKILLTELYSNDNFGIEEARIVDRARYNLMNGESFYSLVDLIDKTGHMSKEAQVFFATRAECKNLIKHEIILLDSLSIRLLAKYYIKRVKPPYKIDVLKSQESALAFINKLPS